MSGLHYKKDGTLDMRYRSSREAAAAFQTLAVNYGSLSSHSTATPLGQYGGGLQPKKNGTLEMPPSSSKLAAAPLQTPTDTPLRYDDDGLQREKDGMPEMPHGSSKQAAASQGEASSDPPCADELKESPDYGIPLHVPKKKDGTPDMRCKEALVWVADQAKFHGENVPKWVHQRKDGTIDETSAVGRAYKAAMPQASSIEYQKCDDKKQCMTSQQRASRLLDMSGLDDKRPSELMDEMLALLGDHPPCLLFKELFRRQLPAKVRTAMESEDFGNPRVAAKKADELWDETAACREK